MKSIQRFLLLNQQVIVYRLFVASRKRLSVDAVKISVSFLAFIFLALHLNAQQYSFRKYSTSDLRQKYIYQISSNNYGQLLLSTSEGFVKYDGVHTLLRTETDGLKSDFVRCHAATTKGTWLGMFDAGVVFDNGKKLKQIDHDLLVAVQSLVADEKGGAWVGVSNGGICYIDSTFAVKSVTLPDGLLCQSMVRIDDLLLVATDQGLVEQPLNTRGSNFKPRMISVLPKADIIQLAELDSTHIGAATRTGDIYILQKTSSGWKLKARILAADLLPTSDETLLITSLDADLFGQVWVGIFGSGVRRIVFDQAFTGRYQVSAIHKSQGLVSEHIQSIYCDHESNVWCGSYGDGICMLPDQRLTFSDYGLKGLQTDVLSMIWYNDQFYLGTAGGLFVSRNDSQSVNRGREIGLPEGGVLTLLTDVSGNLWIGMQEQGLFLLKAGTNRVVRPKSASNDLLRVSVYSLALSPTHQVLAGTDNGLYVFNPDGGFKHITTEQGLIHNVIKSIACTSDGSIWFASPGSCPHKYKDGEITLYKDIIGLKTFNFNSVAVDAEDKVWYGSAGDGVFYFNGKQFVNYRTKQGILSDYTCSLLPDPVSGMWIGHRNGLSYIGKRNWQYMSLSAQLNYAELNFNSSVIRNTNQLYWGGSRGVYCLDLSSPQPPIIVPMFQLASVYSDSTAIDFASGIEISYGIKSLHFNYIGSYFRSSEAAHFRYFIDGYDQEWHEADFTDKDFVYSLLPDGTYKLRIQVKNAEGNWIEIPYTCSIVVAKPYWKTWWFLFVVTSGIVLVVIVIFRLRTRRLKFINAKLEKEVAARTDELKTRNEELVETQQKLVETYDDVTKSIRYAKMIQLGTLPRLESDDPYVSRLLTNTFIIYLPKDIVSGDFYWFDTQDDQLFIAAVDCTGHGVPGAFMSMIGTQLIADAVNDKHLKSPAAILAAMGKRLQETLRPIDGASTDGMDVALLAINMVTGEATFSGAHRPLWLVRNGELKEFKGAVNSLGGNFSHVTDKVFTDTVLDLQSGDMLYMFSDGYTDQFGGVNHRRFMSRRLKELVTSVSDQSIHVQREKLLDAHLEWRDDVEQTDDVLLIGLRIP